MAGIDVCLKVVNKREMQAFLFILGGVDIALLIQPPHTPLYAPTVYGDICI